MQILLIDRRLPVDLELLDLVGAVGLGGDEDGDEEDFATGVQLAQGVFHVGPGSLVGDVEGTRRVGVEKGLDNLAGLGPGATLLISQSLLPLFALYCSLYQH